MGARGPLLASCLLALLALCHGAAVMSVDLGSEWVKVGVVSPGVPMDIALNRESKRKTPAVVAMRDGERTFGEEAVNVGTRFPSLSYQYILPLSGKKLQNPAVERFQQMFPHYKLEADEARGTVVFRHSDDVSFSVEELLAMQLAQARQTASEHLQQPVTDAVVTVPAFFGQPERRAVLAAAQLSGVKVLQLMNDNAAVALNYGMFRRSSFNATSQFILFYDMGAGSTAATLVGYQLVKTKERGFTETNPQLHILGYAYDRSLGGLAMTLRLRDHLAKVFTANKKTPENVYQSPRAMAKLLKEAERVKKILSANAETVAQVEGLLDEEDFRAAVSRVEFEELCADLFARAMGPLEAALKAAGVGIDVVDQLILVGAATRVPKVQEQLSVLWGKELGKSVNTDEAAALGAVYRAADLSTGFKVMKFHVKDYVMLPIGVDFERDSEDSEGGETTKRKVHRNLFTLGNPYPQKKVITFNRSQQDFAFNVNHGDLSHLSEEEIKVVDGLNLTQVQLAEVAEVYAEHAGDGVESKGLKVHFQMDDSGLLNLTGVEAVFEKTTGGGAAAEEDESTLAKLSSAFGKLFSGDEGKEDSKDKVEVEKEKPADEEKKDDNKEKDTKEDKKSDDSKSKTEDKDANKTAEAKDSKPKIRVVKVPIKYKSTNLNILDLEGDGFKASKEKIAKLDEDDRQRKRREQARNALESFTNDIGMKLYEELYEQSSTEEEREKLRKAASEMSDWLYEDGFEETAAVFEEKLEELKKLTKSLYDRVEEHKSREEGVQALRDILNMTEHFLVQASESVVQGVIVESDISALQKMTNSSNEWLEAKLKEQADTPLTQAPKLRMRALAEKYASLEREVKYVVNKMKAGAARKMREEADAKAKAAAEKAEQEAKKAAEAAAANETETTASNETESASEGEAAAEEGTPEKGETAAPEGEAAGGEEAAVTEEPAPSAAEPATETAGSEENDPESDKRKDTSAPKDETHEEL